ISNNYVNRVVESVTGDLWVATWGGGLNRYDRQRNAFTRYRHNATNPNSPGSDFIRNVMEDRAGNLWLSTEGAGIDMIDKRTGRFTHYRHNEHDPHSVSDDNIRFTFQDRQGNIWAGTSSGGLNLFDAKTQTFRQFRHIAGDPASLSANDIYCMFQDDENRMWIGTNGGGLSRLDTKSWKFRSFRAGYGLQSDAVYSINEDRHHNIWVGTENGGLCIVDPVAETFRTYLHDDVDHESLSNNSIYDICRTTDDNMWIGTFNAGVEQVNLSSRFLDYKHSSQLSSLSDNHILCIAEDSKQRVWIGTDGGGLNLFDPATGTFTRFLHDPKNPESLCGNYVLTVCEDSKHDIWIGTWGDGLSIYNPDTKTFRHFKSDLSNPASLSGNNVWQIYEDKDKNIWVCTYGGGLSLYNRTANSFSHMAPSVNGTTGLNNQKVYSVLDDGRGHLWIGTDGGGMNFFDKQTKTFQHYLHSDKTNSIASNTVGKITLDRDGNLWIPTEHGLSFFNTATNQFTNYTASDGLPSNLVFGILQDNHDRMWISTGNGISCFEPRTKKFENYGVADGLQGEEFKEQAFCRTTSGAFYFGGNNGFNVFFPDSLNIHAFDPPLVMTDLKILNKEVPISSPENASPLEKNIAETKNLTVSYKSAVLEFEFASLDYFNPKRKYSYMLEGFDQTWTSPSEKRSATYTNLGAGNYVFRVKTMMNNGQWSSRVLTLKLTITPPFWKTWWFRLIAGLFVIGSLFSVYTFRISAIKRQKLQLENLVQERTYEVEQQKEVLSENLAALRLMKENLQKEKYLLDCLMDHLPASIYFKDCEGKLTRVSKHMAERFGFTVNEMVGKTDFDLLDYDEARASFEADQEIQNTLIPQIDYQEKETRPDGSVRWLTTTKMPLLGIYGDVSGTFGASRDITSIKLLEDDKHRAEVEKAVSQGKFEIASEVMHDIGNAVIGFGTYLTRIRRLQEQDRVDNLASLAVFMEERRPALNDALGEPKAGAIISLLAGVATGQKKKNEEVNQIITDQFNTITHIQEILDIQRQYVNGRDSREREVVNLRTIINDSLAMLFASIDKASIQVSVEINVDRPVVKGDRTKLMQLLLNLLKNSIEAMSPGSTDNRIVISVNEQDGQLVIEVKDNGVGFHTNWSGKLFTKGFSTKSSAGLGLYHSAAIAESHEATVTVLSDGLHRGAIATVRFKTA
ncbi:MAG TPA: two-component regulator propeller domain-containing protein, partial [Chitinophagaceae bacterium]